MFNLFINFYFGCGEFSSDEGKYYGNFVVFKFRRIRKLIVEKEFLVIF